MPHGALVGQILAPEGRTMKRLALVLALAMLAGCATTGGGNSAPAETKNPRSGTPSIIDETSKSRGGGY